MHFGRCSSLPDEEKRQLLGWGSDIFNSEELQLMWRPKSVRVVLYRDGQAVSSCGLLKQSVTVGERAFELGGIGGVITPPPHQGRGYAGQILGEALRIFAQEWMLHGGMLFCRDALVPFYQARDWQKLDAPVKILQPSGMVDCPTPVMVYPLKGTWPTGAVSIDSLPW